MYPADRAAPSRADHERIGMATALQLLAYGRLQDCRDAHTEVQNLRARVRALEAELVKYTGSNNSTNLLLEQEREEQRAKAEKAKARDMIAIDQAQRMKRNLLIAAARRDASFEAGTDAESFSRGGKLGAKGFGEGPGRRLAAEEPCVRERRPHTNLLQLLPSASNADLSVHDGRCSRRYADIDAAWAACMSEAACVGVVRDNGLRCPSGAGWSKGKGKGRASYQYELRGGGLQRARTAAWVCAPRLAAHQPIAGTFASPNATVEAATAKQGYVFITLGACSLPNYDCTFIREARMAIRALRLVDQHRPIAVLSDGGVPTAALLAATEADLVTVIDASKLAASSKAAATTADLRVRKLLAYGHVTPSNGHGPSCVQSSAVLIRLSAVHTGLAPHTSPARRALTPRPWPPALSSPGTASRPSKRASSSTPTRTCVRHASGCSSTRSRSSSSQPRSSAAGSTTARVVRARARMSAASSPAGRCRRASWPIGARRVSPLSGRRRSTSSHGGSCSGMSDPRASRAPPRSRSRASTCATCRCRPRSTRARTR